MRTAITILSLVLATTGCLTGEPAESETTSDVTLTYSSPTLEIAARIAGVRRSADDLRAVLAATKAPVNPTWALYMKYRSFTAFVNDSANDLDAMANQYEADARIKEAAKVSAYQEVEKLLADMQDKVEAKQQVMDSTLALQQYDLTALAVHAVKVESIVGRLVW